MRCFVQDDRFVLDVLSRVVFLCEMFCLGRQICVRCFVQGGRSV